MKIVKPWLMPSADNNIPPDEDIGIYLHVPFCLRKCPYCSFFSVVAPPGQQKEFASAVKRQVSAVARSGWTKNRKVSTIFVGGGTPTILQVEMLADLLEELNKQFEFAGKEVETSIEVNPATVSLSELTALRRAGCNRISIGVQSLLDKELKIIDRPHTADDAVRTIRDARKAGFTNCNIDLMYGLPGQTAENWSKTLIRALEEQPDHLAIYELTIEEGTPFARLQQQEKLILPPEDTLLEMMALTAHLLDEAGFSRYEISNYAKPGRECLHNLNYWHNGPYLGLGPGSVSYLSGRRYTAVADVDEFCTTIAGGDEWWVDAEELGQAARFRETVIMGLRMTRGISISTLQKNFQLTPSEYYGRTLENLVQAGLVLIQDDHIRLTDRGLLLANRVMAELV